MEISRYRSGIFAGLAFGAFVFLFAIFGLETIGRALIFPARAVGLLFGSSMIALVVFNEIFYAALGLGADYALRSSGRSQRAVWYIVVAVALVLALLLVVESLTRGLSA
jgi:hypothetical protein